MTLTQTRRRFLKMSLAGAAGFVSPMGAMAAEEPLETTTIRLPKTPAICIAPAYAAEELLRAEGFTDIRYVELPTATASPIEAVARGEIDLNLNYSINYVRGDRCRQIDHAALRVHVGCYELFGREGVRSIADLKGKSVGVGLDRSETCW